MMAQVDSVKVYLGNVCLHELPESDQRSLDGSKFMHSDTCRKVALCYLLARLL